MRRQYFHFNELEETEDGLWRIVRGEQRKRNVEDAAELMRDTGSFMWAMRQALVKWPRSCVHNLTAENSNRLAWLGHAGCCIALGSPEENTRCAWHTLTKAEQDEANEAAQTVLDEWIAANWVRDQLDLFEVANDA